MQQELNNIAVSTDMMLEIIMNNDCFVIDDGEMLYNINDGYTIEEENLDEKLLINAQWEGERSDCELVLPFSSVEKIVFDKKWGVYKIYSVGEKEPTELKVLQTVAVEPGVQNDK